MIDDFMTVETLATFWGLVVATGLIVQFTKSIVKDRFGDVAVRLYTLIWALILTFAFTYTGDGIQGVLLTIINSVGVALSAMGGYEAIVDPRAEKSFKEED